MAHDVMIDGFSLQGAHDGVLFATEELDESIPGPRVQVEARVGRHGSNSSQRFQPGRPYPLSGWVEGSDPGAAQDAFDRLKSLLSIDGCTLAWETARGWRHAPVYRSGDFKHRWTYGDIEFDWATVMFCDDGIEYAGNGSPAGSPGSGWLVGSTGLPSPGVEGLRFPITFPITFASSGASSGSITLTNPGSTGRLSLRINGPVSKPSVSWAQGERSGLIQWGVDLAAGEFITWETGGTPLLQGQSARNPIGLLPGLKSGPITFTFGGTSPGNPLLTIGLLPGFGG